MALATRKSRTGACIGQPRQGSRSIRTSLSTSMRSASPAHDPAFCQICTDCSMTPPGMRRGGKTCKKGTPEASAATIILQQWHDTIRQQSQSPNCGPRRSSVGKPPAGSMGERGNYHPILFLSGQGGSGGSPSTSRTGVKERRWIGETPSRLRAATCSRTG